MRIGLLPLVLITALSGSLLAKDVDAQEALKKKISLSVKNEEMGSVLKKIGRQAGVKFVYINSELPVHSRLSFDASGEELGSVLTRVLGPLSIRIETMHDQIILKKLFVQGISPAKEPPVQVVAEENALVSGVVVDEKGQPLAGASITLKGTTRGGMTDAKGRFNVNAEETDTLEVSLVGYKTIRVRVVVGKLMTVKLVSTAADLSDMVVVGYGTTKKENLTGAVGVIRAASLADRPTSSPANLLQGLSPGLTVTTQGSYPGASANIKIRETSTWQGSSDPLFVIDGFVRDAGAFASLNPADIDNISILKDAASAAIYGIKGGNGVILVTTKQGVAEKTTIAYNASYTINTREITPRRMNAFEAYTFADQAYDQKNIAATDPSYYTPDELTYFKTHSYDWLKDTWRNPWNTAHNLSMSGGSKGTRYYISGGFLRQQGATSNSFFKYNLLAKLDGQISKSLSYSLNVNAEWDNSDRPFWAYDNGDFNLSNMYNRLLMVTPGRPSFINNLPVANFDNTNTASLAKGAGGYTRPANNSLSPTFQLKYEIPGVKGLTAKGIFAYNTYNSYTKAWRNAPFIYYFKTTGEHNHIVTDQLDSLAPGGYKIRDQAQTSGVGAPTELKESYVQSSNYQLDLMLNYERTFGLHNISAIAGYEQSAYRGHFSTIWDDNYSNPGNQQINGGSPNSTDWSIAGDQNQPTGFASYLGRIDYNYASTYMLGVTFRADGSYVFPANKRWGYFPSFSAAWNIAREKFFEPLTRYLDFAKLRFSYGITGTDNTAPWQWQQTYAFNSSSGVYLGSSLPPSVTLGSTINPNITWEKNHNYNLGLDLAMPKRLVSATIDAWYKKTTDILGARNASVPSTVGASLPAVNYGIASARGIELSVSHENRVGNIMYRVGVNWAVSSNKFLTVDQPQSVRDYENEIGRPINGWVKGYVSEGIIRTQEDVDKILKANGPGFTIFGYAPRPGMLMYKDLRGPLGSDAPDGKIDGNDQTPITFNNVPRINYGFNFMIGWKGLEVSAIFSGLARYQLMPTDVYYRRPLPGNNNLEVWKNAWTPQTAATASMPSPVMNDWQGTSNAEQSSTFWLMNGAFLRLKSLLVNYNLPARLFSGSQIKGIRVYFSGENLYQWNHTVDWDPELGGDFRTYPILKGFTFGLNATF